MTMLSLTWSGFDAAIDLIAAQCTRKDRSGVYGASPAGLVMAVALSSRLGLPLLSLPTPGMLLVEGLATPGLRLPEEDDTEVWVWVDATPGQHWNSVVRAEGDHGQVVFPWQEAFACQPVRFMPGFHD